MWKADDDRRLHATIWRWHFYAGLYVGPFLILLSLTGLVMLARGPLERWQFGPVDTSTPSSTPSAHQARLDAARDALPGATVVRYQPGATSVDATRVTATVHNRPHTVYVDGGTGRVRGIVDDTRRLGALAETIHGTLLMGDVGDRLIEIAAGLGVLLLISGVYLWFPAHGDIWQSFRLRRGTRRVVWRDVHMVTGVVLAPVLLFYLISGLAWTGIWGGRYVQAWSTFPPEKFGPTADATTPTHEALNGGGAKVVPWNLEQTRMPRSSAGDSRTITLDEAIAIAERAGIGERFWVGVPADANGVWTVAQTAFDGNLTDPLRELTVHVDQRTGLLRGRVGFGDYSWGAKAMAVGIPLHEGFLGPWNLAGAIVVCLATFMLSVSGLVAWWLRRPARRWRLAAPPRPASFRVPAAVWVIVAVLGLAFPLLAATLLSIAVLDRAIVRRVRWLRQLLN